MAGRPWLLWGLPPTLAGIKLPRGTCLAQATGTMEAAPASCVFSAGVGWRLRKGGRGQSPGMAQKWGQEGPWRRRGASAPSRPQRPDGWLVQLWLPPPRLCLVIRAPTVCPALRWGPAERKCVLLWRSGCGQEEIISKRCVMSGGDKRTE